MVKRLAIIDWGIGGIGIYKLIKERFGAVGILYFSDTGAVPYGKMSRLELVARLETILLFLKSREITHLVIGCNAASTVFPYLKLKGLKAEGIINSAVRATEKLKPERLVLIGGRRTVLSGVYRKAMAEKGIEVKQRIAQPLSAFIESGDVSSDNLRRECSRILSPVKYSSHILLACTHYPAIIPLMKDLVSPQTIFIDPAEQLLSDISKWKLPEGGKDIFLTSGDVNAMKSSALKAFGCEISQASNISV